MALIIQQIANYLIILCMILYSLRCFTVFNTSDENKRRRLYGKQIFYMLIIHFICYLLMYIHMPNIRILIFYIIQLVFIIFTLVAFTKIYPTASRLLTNNMCFLLTIGFIMITRISYDSGVRQFVFAVLGVFITLIIPMFIEKLQFLQKLHWIYGGVGLVSQAALLLIGTEKYGAKIWIIIAGVSFQPSEIVKILFVFFIAAMFASSVSKKQIFLTSVIAAAFVIVLVLEKDLGSALLFSVIYLVVLYIATLSPLLFYGGLLAGSGAAVVAYKLFEHVKVRVNTWIDPFQDINQKGYQLAQSLFAIGTGGMLGFGLCEGKPNIIPVATSDFIFAAISEELGGLFAICLVLIYLSCFFMFITIAMKLKNNFYKYIGLGLSISFIFQAFLNIGGVIKFIPLTGVTLPLISYGGTSILSTIMIFGIIQGLYVLNQNEVEKNEEERTQYSERDRYNRQEGPQTRTLRRKESNKTSQRTAPQYYGELPEGVRKIKRIKKIKKIKKNSGANRYEE